MATTNTSKLMKALEKTVEKHKGSLEFGMFGYKEKLCPIYWLAKDLELNVSTVGAVACKFNMDEDKIWAFVWGWDGIIKKDPDSKQLYKFGLKLGEKYGRKV